VASEAPRSHEDRLAGLKLDGEGPVWLQIRRAIAAPILKGEWRPGDRIPGELELVRRFGAARMTVARAIQSLAAEGVVQRRRKAGTVVAERPQERPVFEIWDTEALITRTGAVYGYRLIDCGQLADGDAQRALLGVGAHVPVLRILCLHLADGRPYQLEERLVNLDAAPGISCGLLETTAPGPWLIAHVPWTEAEHAIFAREADAATAALLETAAGSACLVVERKTWNGEVPVTLARLWHAGPQHRLTGRFAPAR
jgi:GntR family histidine utilization transcriptional repressor